MNKHRLINNLYWCIPIVSILMQLGFTIAGHNQLRPEEIGDSIRGPLWLSHGLVYQGLTSHLGWYYPLLVLYTIFGFSLRMAAWYRLGLHIISIVCLALLFKKYLNVKYAWLPLSAIAFSPTLLYFNSVAFPCGVDLQFLPICLFFLDKINFSPPHSQHITHNLLLTTYHILFFSLSMLAWMSYPTFIVYLPALFLWYLRKKPKIHHIGIGIVAFILPLLLSLLFVSNRNVALWDPADGSGIFRGSGHIGNLEDFLPRIRDTLAGFTSNKLSYYFELPKHEFSSGYAIFSLLFLFTSSGSIIFTTKKLRLFFFLIGFTLFFSLILIGITIDSTGMTSIMRRATGILSATYALIPLLIYGVQFNHNRKYLLYVFVGILSLIPFHHLLVYHQNLTSLSTLSTYSERSWFRIKESPQASLKFYLDQLKKDTLFVNCPEDPNTPTDCLYINLFAVVQSACTFGKIQCQYIIGKDIETNAYLPMMISRWDSYWIWEKYFPSNPTYAEYVNKVRNQKK